MRQLHEDIDEDGPGGCWVWPVLVGAVVIGLLIVMVARCGH